MSRAVELLERLQRSGELPPQKLQALQRVLQSRFCSAIREVSLDYASQQRLSHLRQGRATAQPGVLVGVVVRGGEADPWLRRERWCGDHRGYCV